MISLRFNIRNPWSDRWACTYHAKGDLLIENKSWEIQVNKCTDIIGFEFQFTTRQSHAGLYLSLALFGYDFIFHVYDHRHWDDEKNCWTIR